ncbi:MAG: type II toxin-antitoxin system prevent-host-death family antitoxin [Elusimicrobia bacterium]|nr:type II toxin-antitoxin system prevent-host-death family antitoxin [Elusimicrobiota bacterium]
MTLAQILKARHVGVKELKNNLSMLLRTHKPIVATDRGQPAYMLIPYDEMVDLLEMLEESRDQALVAMVQSGRKAYAAGRWRPAAKVLKKLEL